MKYLKLQLKGSKQEVLDDILALEWNDQKVFPNWPEGYQISLRPGERFIVTDPRQEVLEPGQYSKDGEEVVPPVLGSWISNLVLPENYPTENFKTINGSV